MFRSVSHCSKYKPGTSYGFLEALKWLSNKEILSWSGKDLYYRVASIYKLTRLERIYFLSKLKSLDLRLYNEFTSFLLKIKHSSIPYYPETGDEWHWFESWDLGQSFDGLIVEPQPNYSDLINSYSTFIDKSSLIASLDTIRKYQFSFETVCYYYFGVKVTWNLVEMKAIAEVLVMLIDNKVLIWTTGGFKFVGVGNPNYPSFRSNDYKGCRPKFDFRVISNSIRYRFRRKK